MSVFIEVAGWLADPSHWNGSDGIPIRLVEHVQLSAESVAIGALIALPLAVPLVMAGIRTSAVQVVATATLAAEIAGGGLGRYIVDGFDQQDYTKMAAGAVLVGVLALATELSLAGIERLFVPKGIRLQLRPLRQRAATFKTA